MLLLHYKKLAGECYVITAHDALWIGMLERFLDSAKPSHPNGKSKELHKHGPGSHGHKGFMGK